MSELESNLFYDTRFVHDIEKELNSFIECDVCLGTPIQSSQDPRVNLMTSNEREYTRYLLRKGVIPFPEPELIGFPQTPDFFVWKPNTHFWETPYSGFFYELTLCTRDQLESNSKYASKKFARKRRQKEMFESLGLPIMYICREDQERIRGFEPYSNLY